VLFIHYPIDFKDYFMGHPGFFPQCLENSYKFFLNKFYYVLYILLDIFSS